MRTRVVVFCLVILASVVRPTAGDELKLSNGGALRGTLQEVTFLVDGKQEKHAGSNVAALTVSPAAQDILELKDDTELKGELVSLRFRSIGGALSFERKSVSAITFATTALARARKEFAAKKAALEADDAKGLLELAKWCREKELRAEAVELAKAALKAAPEEETADEAKKFLGIGEKPPDDPGPADPEPAEKPKLTAAEIEALKKAAAVNADLHKTYTSKVDDLKKQELAQTGHDSEKQQLIRQYKKLKEVIKRKKGARDKAMDDYRAKYGKYMNHPQFRTYYEQYKPKFNDHLADDEKTLSKIKKNMAQLAALIKRDQSRVLSTASRRKFAVQTLYYKCKGILSGGKLLTRQEMTDAYQARLDSK